MRRKFNINTTWSANLAYLIGYIAADGSLSIDGRHISIVSKDIEHLEKIKAVFGLNLKICMKRSGYTGLKIYGALQIGDKNFHDFLRSIGLTNSKSKTIGHLKIPVKYFSDFLRGCIDGDGNIQISWHKESKHPQLKIRLYSASNKFILWVKKQINLIYKIPTGWTYSSKEGMYNLSYGKTDSFKILKLLYYDGVSLYLDRKYQIYLRASGVMVATPLLGSGAARRGGSSPLSPTKL